MWSTSNSSSSYSPWINSVYITGRLSFAYTIFVGAASGVANRHPAKTGMISFLVSNVRFPLKNKSFVLLMGLVYHISDIFGGNRRNVFRVLFLHRLIYVRNGCYISCNPKTKHKFQNTSDRVERVVSNTRILGFYLIASEIVATSKSVRNGCHLC